MIKIFHQNKNENNVIENTIDRSYLLKYPCETHYQCSNFIITFTPGVYYLECWGTSGGNYDIAPDYAEGGINGTSGEGMYCSSPYGTQIESSGTCSNPDGIIYPGEKGIGTTGHGAGGGGYWGGGVTSGGAGGGGSGFISKDIFSLENYIAQTTLSDHRGPGEAKITIISDYIPKYLIHKTIKNRGNSYRILIFLFISLINK